MKNFKDVISISGYGSISPLGIEKDEVYKNYLDRDTCFSQKKCNDKIYPVGVLNDTAAKRVNELAASDKKYCRLDRVVLMAILAAERAFKDAGADKSGSFTVNIGSSRGATGLFEKYHEEFIKSGKQKTRLLTSPLTTLGNISGEVAAYLDIKGADINSSVTCSTALHTILNAMAWLRAEMCNGFIAGGSEAPVTDFTLAQVEALGIYTKNFNTRYPCRPLAKEEKNENTFALGEGSAVFILKKENIKRLAKKKLPYLIIESAGYSYKNPPSATGIDEDGSLIAQSMSMAVENMITAKPVDLILLHGTGTIKGDKAEMNAIKNVFGNNIPNLYSNKWKIGHTYAASGALSLELAILAINNGIHLDFPYSSVVKNKKRKVEKVMINSTGFGGNAVSLIVSSPSGIMEQSNI